MKSGAERTHSKTLRGATMRWASQGQSRSGEKGVEDDYEEEDEDEMQFQAIVDYGRGL